MDRTALGQWLDMPFDPHTHTLEYFLEQFDPLLKLEARRYLALGRQAVLEYADLYQIGRMALLLAHARFRPSAVRRKYKSGTLGHFFTYARKAIQRHCNRAINQAAGLPVNRGASCATAQLTARQVSFEALENTLADPFTVDEAAFIAQREALYNALYRALNTLSEQDRYLIEIKFGLSDQRVKRNARRETFEAQFGVRVKRINARTETAIKRLRAALAALGYDRETFSWALS